MSFGIGLGAFVEGLDRGMNMRERFDQRREANTIKKGLQDIETDTKAKFADPLSDEAYNYMMKRQELLYQSNGQIEKALAFRKFGQEESTRRGAGLFSSSLVKANTGDIAGALSDAIEAGKVKGYLDHGYEVLGQDPIKGEDGSVAGYRLRLRDPKGKEVQQDVAVGDVPRLISTFANPDAAFQAQQAKSAADASDAKKRSENLEDYEKKKEIDKKYEKPAKDADSEAYLKVAEDFSKNDLDWGDRSPEEQDKLIRQRLDAGKAYANPAAAPGGGQVVGDRGGPPAQSMIVDQGTGEQVQPPDASQTQAIGLGGGSPAAAPEAIGLSQGAGVPTPTPRPDPRAQATAAAPGGVAPSPSPAPAPAQRAPSKQELIQDAANYMTQGGNPEAIAQKLQAFGISEQEWPTTVRSALAKKQAPVAIGLGG